MPILITGVTEFHEAEFVWEKTIMINIEGEIQKIIPSQLREVQPNKNKMTGGGPGLSLSPVSGGGTVQPWRRCPNN
jgi:hypothetical protein